MRAPWRGSVFCSLLCLAGFPAGWSVVEGALTRPRAVETAGGLPSLAFDQYLVDLDKVDATDEIAARFGFTNSGRNLVKITGWEASCGCLQPSLKKREFHPYETGQFFLRVRTAAQQPGRNEYRLTVHYEDPEPHSVQLVFRATLPAAQVFLRPRALAFYQLSHRATSQELAVIDLREFPLSVLAARSSSDLAVVELGPVDRDEAGMTRQRLTVTVAGEVPPGQHRAVISLFTDDKKYPELKVPLMIYGASKPGPIATTEPPRHQ